MASRLVLFIIILVQYWCHKCCSMLMRMVEVQQNLFVESQKALEFH